MRAKFVFENLEFEKGMDPKGAMGLGGIELDQIYSDLVDGAQKEYENFIRKNFIGKRITGTFVYGIKPGGDWKEWTINVADIDYRFGGKNFTIIDDQGNRYIPLTSDPIQVLGKINEEINFEKTGNPKSSLDIGGIQLSKVRKDIIDRAKEEWIQWIKDHLLGKTLTGKFNRVGKKIDDGYEFTGDGWGNYTFTIKEMITPDWDITMEEPALFVLGEDDWQYVVPIGANKIWIK
jgi:hypothetical protein